MHGAHLDRLEPRLAKLNAKIRPGAGGHRFGPDLQCTECGRYWDAHQQNPRPCTTPPRGSAAAFTATDKPKAGQELARTEGDRKGLEKLDRP